MQYGGSVQLNCSLACAGGTVQWKGLDTNLGSISSFPTHSILHISSAAVTTAGPKTCQGTCHGERYQDSVNLKVYGKRPPAQPRRLPSKTLGPQGSPPTPPRSWAVVPKPTT